MFSGTCRRASAGPDTLAGIADAHLTGPPDTSGAGLGKQRMSLGFSTSAAVARPLLLPEGMQRPTELEAVPMNSGVVFRAVASEHRLVLNHLLEVSPRGDRFELRLPAWNRRLEATAEQVAALKTAADWTPRFALDHRANRKFVDRCIAEGFLLEADEHGEPKLPTRAKPQFTMFDTPHADLANPAAFTFLGVPWDGSTTGGAGARFGPTNVRMRSGASYGYDIDSLAPRGFVDLATGQRLLDGVTLADAGDVAFAPGSAPELVYGRVTEAVREILDAGSIPVVLGGDHSLTYPILRAFPEQRMGIIHLDAHTDLSDPLPGAGLDHGNVFTYVLEELPHVERLVQMGMRGVVEGGSIAPPTDVVRFGIDTLREFGVEEVLANLPDDLPYYLSIDIDVVDPMYAPATGTPVSGGLFPHELKSLVRRFTNERQVIGMDLVEVADPVGPHDHTAALAAQTILTAMDGVVSYQLDRI